MGRAQAPGAPALGSLTAVLYEAHRRASQLLSPWQGIGVFCAWTVLLLGAAGYLLVRRDA